MRERKGQGDYVGRGGSDLELKHMGRKEGQGEEEEVRGIPKE